MVLGSEGVRFTVRVSLRVRVRDRDRDRDRVIHWILRHMLISWPKIPTLFLSVRSAAVAFGSSRQNSAFSEAES